MPSRVIRPTAAPADAPFAYTVGGVESLAPEAVFASWDGTGAGADFLPCVSFYSAEGVLLNRAFPTTGVVKSGDTAEVSYRPFDRSGGGSGGGAALATTGGGVTVSPTTLLNFLSGFVVQNAGGGQARVTPLDAFFVGDMVSFGSYMDGDTITMFDGLSRGFSFGSSTYTVRVTGYYAVAIQPLVSMAGPCLASMSFGVHAAPFGAEVAMQVPRALAPGDSYLIDVAGVGFIHYTAGDTISIAARSVDLNGTFPGIPVTMHGGVLVAFLVRAGT